MRQDRKHVILIHCAHSPGNWSWGTSYACIWESYITGWEHASKSCDAEELANDYHAYSSLICEKARSSLSGRHAQNPRHKTFFKFHDEKKLLIHRSVKPERHRWSNITEGKRYGDYRALKRIDNLADYELIEIEQRWHWSQYERHRS